MAILLFLVLGCIIIIIIVILSFEWPVSLTTHCTVCIYFSSINIGTLSTPVLTYKNTLNEILVSWSPIVSDTVCGPVTYNISIMPSHGMMMMINNTAYNITGLYYNTNYTITVYAANNAADGEPAMVTVKTPGLYVAPDKCAYNNYSSLILTHIHT